MGCEHSSPTRDEYKTFIKKPFVANVCPSSTQGDLAMLFLIKKFHVDAMFLFTNLQCLNNLKIARGGIKSMQLSLYSTDIVKYLCKILFCFMNKGRKGGKEGSKQANYEYNFKSQTS